MPVIDEVDRPEPLRNGTDAEMLWSMVDYYRATALVKCQGLDEPQLKLASTPPSNLTLLGILRHLTEVELYWFRQVFLGEDVEAPYSKDDEPDAELLDLDSAPATAVVAAYLAACRGSRLIAGAHQMDELAVRPRKGFTVSLRYLAIHMIDEYARHCGHLDLIREAIDGAIGD
jgi:Protein of unknown function (DUF664)